MVCPFVDSDFETTEQTGRGDEFAKWKKTNLFNSFSIRCRC